MGKYYPYLIALLAVVLAVAVYLWFPVRPRGMPPQSERGTGKIFAFFGRPDGSLQGQGEIQARTSSGGKSESQNRSKDRSKSQSKSQSKNKGGQSDKRPGRDLRGRKRLASRGSAYRAEVYLLARTIYGEARGEPYIGQVAVGAVILNRVDSPLFPNTMAGVIYEPGAFSAVSDGQIYQEPDTEALRAAEDAVNGWDPSGGALYYYNPAKATSAWIWQRPVIKVIGHHVFTR